MKQVIQKMQDIVGKDHVVTDPDLLRPYITEVRDIFTGSTPCAVRPANTAEVGAVMAWCYEHDVEVVPQGGHTGNCGGAMPDDSNKQIVLSLSRLNDIRDIDPLNDTMTVGAGCILADIQAKAADHDRLFPLSLAAEGSCQIGGNIATNAGGINVLRYGNMKELVLGLEVVLPDGRIWDGLRALRKDNTGYDLKQHFMGSEGTLGIVTAAVLKLSPAIRQQSTAFIAVPDPDAALAVLAIAKGRTGNAVSACELLPRFGLEIVTTHSDQRDPLSTPSPWYLLLELTSPLPGNDLSTAMEGILETALEQEKATDAVIAQNDSQRAALWQLRETLPDLQKKEGGSIKHDVAVPVSSTPTFLDQALKAVIEKMPTIRPVPFGHLGDGNIHFNLTQPADMEKDVFLSHWGEMNDIVHAIVRDMNGSISAEHGIGQLKTDELPHYKSDLEMQMMRDLKNMYDPKGLLNPGKVLNRP